MIRKIDSFVHAFDKFSEPVANINMNGQTHYKTRLGGLCGIMVYSLMAWFIVLRYQKMMALSEPAIFEVTQGMNLMADDSPSFNLAESNFNIGYGIFGS